MDNDQRDRRDWPESDTTPGATDEAVSRTPDMPPAPEGPDEGITPARSTEPAPSWEQPLPSDSEPMPSDTEPKPSDAEPMPSDAEPMAPRPVDAWPTDAPAAEPTLPEPVSASDIEAWPSQDADSRPWPTEPPAAGSGSEDTWPTAAPEPGGREMPADTEPMPADAPSAEVEAYPSTAAAEEAAPVAAAAQATPPSQAATGESTQCPRCGTENAPGLAFCRNCGQRLIAAGVAPTIERPGTPEGTMACPRCGTHNRAGVAFCQNCGANLRGTAPGYVPPAVAGAGTAAAGDVERRGGAVLGPVVLLIGVVGLVTAYLLPFLYGDGSLFERAFGAGGYGIGFWSAYPDVASGLSNQAYFGLAAPVPLLAALLVILALAGFVRAAPGRLQVVGLAISLLWSVGLIVLFIIVEVLGNWGGDLVGLLRGLTPAGIIFFLASLIVLIGTLTRFGRA
jgi:double zinc ribbon protein